jgi:hypothetical protein
MYPSFWRGDLGPPDCQPCAAGSPVVCGECLWLTSADRADIIHDADVERWQVPENLAHPFRPVHRTCLDCGITEQRHDSGFEEGQNDHRYRGGDVPCRRQP